MDGEPAPDRNDEYLFYQALLGAWPAEPAGTAHQTAPAELVDRLRNYMVKAVKEAKVHTSWINPNKAYDEAVVSFVDRTLTGPRTARFLADFLPFQHRVARLGMINSLAQVVLKIASPGVPDFYQGTELWDLSLVDPDNRRPVDFSVRAGILDELEPYLNDEAISPARGANGDQAAASPLATPHSSLAPRPSPVPEMLEHWPDGRIKLFLMACGLQLRRRLHRVFLEGEYLPLETQGPCADNVVALARRHGRDIVLAVVPRFISRLVGNSDALTPGPGAWTTTSVALPTRWAQLQFRNIFTRETLQATANGHGASIRAADILATCPVALLAAAL
jgi:(1->4)-alpha-D-glucan 1-alpha-D-glucosylmutase